MATPTLYGIKNCDTVKKSRTWLDDRGIDYHFHDFRADGLDSAQVKQWLEHVSWETLLNKRGTTWRKLPLETQRAVDEDNVISLLVANPTLIKRPVFTIDDKILVGFKDIEEQVTS